MYRQDIIIRMSKDMSKCLKCGTNLQTYFERPSFKYLMRYKRCPNCLTIYELKIRSK